MEKVHLSRFYKKRGTYNFYNNSHWVIPEKIHTPPTDGILEILAEGGAKTLEIQAGGGVELEKVFCRGHFNR